MQLQKFLRPLQNETDRLIKTLLSENPSLKKKYVDSGVNLIGSILEPLNVFMRHLLTVQGLDPESVPGENERRAFQLAMDELFGGAHEKSFDDDYDLSWVHKRFEDTRQKLSQLELTKEKFLDLTDIAKLPSISDNNGEPVTIDLAKVNQIAPEADKREIRLRATEQERENQEVLDIGADAINALRQAIENIERDVLTPKEKTEALKRTAQEIKKGLKPGKKKLNKGKKTSSKGTRVKRDMSPSSIEGYVEKRSAIKESLKAKLDRCRKIVDNMVIADLIGNNPDDMKEQLDQVLLFNDEALGALERVVANQIKSQQAPFGRAKK